MAFAAGLTAMRAQLNAVNARLTVCVADWSPLLSQYATLGPAVDRLLDMETYNAPDQATWTGYFNTFVTDTSPKTAVRDLGVVEGGTDGRSGRHLNHPPPPLPPDRRRPLPLWLVQHVLG